MAEITFDHAVIYNGVFYPANEKIIADDKKVKEAEETPKEKNKKKGVK